MIKILYNVFWWYVSLSYTKNFRDKELFLIFSMLIYSWDRDRAWVGVGAEWEGDTESEAGSELSA